MAKEHLRSKRSNPDKSRKQPLPSLRLRSSVRGQRTLRNRSEIRGAVPQQPSFEVGGYDAGERKLDVIGPLLGHRSEVPVEVRIEHHAPPMVDAPPGRGPPAPRTARPGGRGRLGRWLISPRTSGFGG